MKKLLLSLTAIALIASTSTTVVSCSYLDTQKISVKNKVQNLMKSTSHFFKPGILANAEEFNIANVREEMKNKTLSSIDNSKDTTKLNEMFGLFFEDDDMDNFYSSLETQDGFNYESKYNPIGATIKTISGLIKTIQQNIRGLNPGIIVDNVLSQDKISKSLTKTSGFNDILNQLAGISDDMDGIKNTIKTISEDVNNVNIKVQSITKDISEYYGHINALKADSINDLKAFYNESSTDFIVDDIRYWSFGNLALTISKATNYVDPTTNEPVCLEGLSSKEGFDLHFTNMVNMLLSGEASFVWNGDLVKNIINFIMGLNWYVQSFNEYKVDRPKDDNHLFSNEETNYAIFQKVQSNKIDSIEYFNNLDISWDSVLQVLLDLFDPNKNDENSYANTRIFKILFQGEDQVKDFGYNDKFGIGVELNPLKGLGISWDGSWANQKSDNGLLPILYTILPSVIRKVVPNTVLLDLGFLGKVYLHNVVKIDKLGLTITNMLSSLLANNAHDSFFKDMANNLDPLLQLAEVLKLPVSADKIKNILNQVGEATDRPINLIMNENLLGKIIGLITGTKINLNLSDVINFNIPGINIKLGSAINFLITGTLNDIDKISNTIGAISNLLNELIKNIDNGIANIQTAFGAFKNDRVFDKKIESGEWKIYNPAGLLMTRDQYFTNAEFGGAEGWWKDENNPPNDFLIATSMFQKNVKFYNVIITENGHSKKVPISKIAYELLGYDANNQVGIKNGMLWKIQRIWTGITGQILDAFFNIAGALFNSAAENYPDDPDKNNYMKYMNDSNFSYVIDYYENFADMEFASKVGYTITYTNSKKEKYHYFVEIELLPSENSNEYSKYKIVNFSIKQ